MLTLGIVDYINGVKCKLRDEYGFMPLPGSTKEEPLLDVPDGEYPMTIEDKLDHVRLINGKISCLNFDEPAERRLR